MEPREERFTRPELAGVHLRVLLWGEAPAPLLVLLHGAGANAHWWDHLAPALARDYFVAALDFRGHGGSDHPEAHYAGAFVEDLAALISQLRGPGADGPAPEAAAASGRTFVVGASLGAHVAASYAARRDALDGMVLIDPSRGVSRTRRRATQLALTLRPTYATRAQALERFRFLPRAHAAEDLRLGIAERSVRQESDGRYGYNFDPRWFSVEPSGVPDFRAVRCPTLVVRGETSWLLPSLAAKEIVAEIPKAKLVEIEGAGHHVHLDRPGDTLAVIRDFLHGLR